VTTNGAFTNTGATTLSGKLIIAGGGSMSGPGTTTIAIPARSILQASCRYPG